MTNISYPMLIQILRKVKLN